MNRKLYCFWFGPGMSEARRDCFKSIVKNSKVTIELVTEKNLANFVSTATPLHPCFNFLSNHHKADYLRSYFMHHYGGGYMDIKRCDFDWNVYFDLLESSDKQFMGYQEKLPDDIAYEPSKPLWEKLIGYGQFIFKPNTNFAKHWFTEVNSKIDTVADLLEKFPGNRFPSLPENHSVARTGYPLQWSEIGARITHRLLPDYFGEYSMDLPFININGYR